jgi:nucleoside-diphosphate-sugar epimerase
MTIVRPSHTYDRTMIPVHGGFTVIERMRKGKKVVVPGDGSSIWVLTHHTDFATGFVGLMGNQKAIGEAFHITSDELLTWNLIYGTLAEVAGGRFNPVYVPSDVIAHFDPGWGDSLLGDKTHSMIFDNSKIKKFVPDFEAKVPFRTGAEEIVSWYDADAGRRAIDQKFDLMLDSIIVSFAKVLDS